MSDVVYCKIQHKTTRQIINPCHCQVSSYPTSPQPPYITCDNLLGLKDVACELSWLYNDWNLFGSILIPKNNCNLSMKWREFWKHLRGGLNNTSFSPSAYGFYMMLLGLLNALHKPIWYLAEEAFVVSCHIRRHAGQDAGWILFFASS